MESVLQNERIRTTGILRRKLQFILYTKAASNLEVPVAKSVGGRDEPGARPSTSPSHPNPSGYLDKTHLNSVSHTINVNLTCRGATITFLCVGRNYSLVKWRRWQELHQGADFTQV